MTTWNQARHILCIRLDSMGDVLMTSPAFRALKNAGPGRQLTLLTGPAGAEAGALIPEIDRVISYQAPWMKASAPRRSSRADLALLGRLMAGHFDAAVIFTSYSQSALPAALTCWLAEIPLRLAYSREKPYHLLSDHRPELEPEKILRHETQRQLDLVASVGAFTADVRLSLRPARPAYEHVRAWLAGQGISGPWMVVHVGASAPSRRYPAAHFTRVIDLLAAEGIHAVLTGSAAEAPLVAEVLAGSRAGGFSAAGAFDLSQTAALIDLAPLIITNNSGPAHIAAAMGTPVVDLYALTNPQHTPWAVPSRVLSYDVPCKFCYSSICKAEHHDCLRQIAPEQVLTAALDLLAETGSLANKELSA